MSAKIRRRRYFIHPSSQFKYIAMSVLPALVMSIFCIYFLIKTGELLLQKEKGKLTLQVSSIDETLRQLEKENYPKGAIEKIEILKKKLLIFKDILGIKYFAYLEEWAKTKMALLTVLAMVLVCVGIISLLFSHRIAGPIYRIRKSIDMLSEGKDIPPVQLRKYDEFKELAASLEKLRKILKEKGFLESKVK